MRIRVLGCSGGIGAGARTTSFLVDTDILLDAGTGVGDLELGSLALIDHIFVTHSHLDHVACIPFLVDTVCTMRTAPITVYGLPGTVDILRTHLFNGKLWPDFTRIPDSANPYLVFREIRAGQPVVLGDRKFTAIPANHTVPAVGYSLATERAALVFSGDTTVNEALWEAVNAEPNLRYLVIETAFPDKERELAAISKHLCPATLAAGLAKMRGKPEVFITHLKPGEGALTMAEIGASAGAWAPRMLETGQVFEL